MRRNFTLLVLLLGLFFGGCATDFMSPIPEVQKALAPTGKLRAGIILTNALQVTKDAATGELRGVTIDIGKELGRRIGVPFEPVGYPSVAALVESVRSDQWDIAFLAIDPARATVMEFAPFMEVEVGYLVRAGSSINALTEMDKPGIRVAVQDKSAPDIILSRSLKNAVLVRGSNLPAMIEILRSGKADAFAANKPNLFSASEQLAGSQVLDGRFSTVPYAIATSKGGNVGTAYVQRFVEDVKANGLVKSAIEKAGLRGVVVAPLQ